MYFAKMKMIQVKQKLKKKLFKKKRKKKKEEKNIMRSQCFGNIFCYTL